MQTLWTAVQIFGGIVGALILVGGAIGVIWFAATNRVRSEKRQKAADKLTDDEARLRPYKEAADGYRLQVEQLERDVSRLKKNLKQALDERDNLRARVRELEELTVNQAAALLRQQGELDRLKRQVEDLGDLRGQLNDVLAQIKNPAGR
jgi:predicted RNase H-like nuclease (RuvC/YqgF family)